LSIFGGSAVHVAISWCWLGCNFDPLVEHALSRHMGKTIPETYKDLDPADLDTFVAKIQGDVIDKRFRTNQAAQKPNTVKPPKSMGDGKVKDQ
jgi:(2Fe-2S) ferredoxin